MRLLRRLIKSFGLIRLSHEDSQFDASKDTVFTRLVYAGEILEERDFILDPEEHTDFKWISSLERHREQSLCLICLKTC